MKRKHLLRGVWLTIRDITIGEGKSPSEAICKAALLAVMEG